MNLKHLGCIIAATAIIAVIPETAIALDNSAATENMNTNTISVSAVALATAQATSMSNDENIVVTEAKAKTQAEADAKAKAKAAAKAAKAKAKAEAEKQAVVKRAATKTRRTKPAKKAKSSTTPNPAPAVNTNSSSDNSSSNPTGIPDKYTVVNSFTVKAYAYTGGGTTASGKKARVGLVAVDPRVIPLGTILYIKGYGICVAADTGGNIKGKTVDLYKNTESECRNWGVRYVDCYILK